MSIFSRRPAKPTQQPQRRDLTAPAVQPTPVRRVSLAEQEEMGLAPRPAPSMYVPAASEIIQMPRVNLTSPDANITADITPPAVVESKTFGGHQDRARAWLKYAMPLSLTTAAVATIAAVAFERVPLLSFWSLLIFGLAFMATYAILLLRYWRHTPEGVALENVGQLWDYYRREQAHRHAIEREAWTDQRAITRRGDRR